MLKWAATLGPNVAAVVQRIMERKRHPEEGYRASLGVIRLGKRHGNARLELACGRALSLRSPSYKTVESILKAGLEEQPLPGTEATPQTMPDDHDNVRGPASPRPTCSACARVARRTRPAGWPSCDTSRTEGSAMLKAIHVQEDRAEAMKKAKSVTEKLRQMKLAKAADLLEAGVADTLRYY